jgi:hypothetical protein
MTDQPIDPDALRLSIDDPTPSDDEDGLREAVDTGETGADGVTGLVPVNAFDAFHDPNKPVDGTEPYSFDSAPRTQADAA